MEEEFGSGVFEEQVLVLSTFRNGQAYGENP